MGSSKRTHEIQPDGLSASRSRRENVKAPRRLDDDAPQEPFYVTQRKKREKLQEKRALADTIEADPLANDDELVHDNPPQWSSPTLTGDNALDDANYVEARIDFLVRFIAHRDGEDVRPALNAGELDLDTLEDILEEGLYSDNDNHDKGKGKTSEPASKSITNPQPNTSAKPITKVKPNAKPGGAKLNASAGNSAATPQVQTAYDGITVDKTDNTVAPKKKGLANTGFIAPPPRHLDGLRMMASSYMAGAQGSAAPLKRTDNRSIAGGRPVVSDTFHRQVAAPEFQPQTPVPDQSTGRPLSASPHSSAPRKVGTVQVPVKRSTKANANTGSHGASASQQPFPTPAQSQADRDPHRTVNNSPTARPSHVSKNGGDARNVASHNSPHQHRSQVTQQSGQGSKSLRVKPIQRQMPAHATASIAGHGNHHTVNHSQVVANARSVQNTPHTPARRKAAGESGYGRGAHPHPYPQTQRANRAHSAGHSLNRQTSPDLDNNNGQNQLEDAPRQIQEPEPNADGEEDSTTEPELAEPEVATGLDLLALVNETKSDHKAPIASFNRRIRPIVKEMSDLAKPQIIANGVYDDTEAALAAMDIEWPQEWKPRLTRDQILAKCWQLACAKANMQLPFTRKLTLCVDSLLVSFCTSAKKALKPWVDKHFGFDDDKPAGNKMLCNQLLDHGFHDRNPKSQMNPFEGDYLKEACKRVAFHGGATSMGAKHSATFNNTPPPFIAFICSITHHIILCYRDGNYSEQENLNVSVQTASFRIYLRLLAEKHEFQPLALIKARGEIHDHCWASVGKVPTLPTSQPKRKWNSDIDEVYVRKFNIVSESEAEEADTPEYGSGGDTVPDAILGEDELDELDEEEQVGFVYDGGRGAPSNAGNDDAMAIDG